MSLNTIHNLPALRRRAFLVIAPVLVLALFAAGAASIHSQTTNTKSSSPKAAGGQHSGERTGSAADVARGKYLVEGVAMCGQCHTPRDANGSLDRSRSLQGTPIPYQPSRPDSNWPINVPRIGGTMPANDADMIKLLTTGIWTTGTYLRPPMPQFRMDRGDAEAIVAYLKSVTPAQ
jgi:mono/diheme cytochrome c family protein